MSLFTKVLYKQERKNVNGKKSVTLFEKKFYKVSTYRKFNSFPKKLAFIFSLAFGGSVVAAPILNNVQYNGANVSVNQVGNATNVLANAGNNSIINWNSFDIGSGESVNFNHNGSGHRFFNIVNGPASTIAGQVNAINPNTDVLF